MNDEKNIVIDLSNSFTLAEHYALSDTIIEVDSDTSFVSSVEIINLEESSPKSYKKNKKDTGQKSQVPSKRLKNNEGKTSNKFGECTICYEELGANPLASTKCGHVFCLKCLEECLKIEKKCPVCRCSLKGKLAYHPLYLSK